MDNDWFSKVDPRSPKYQKQVHNILNRDFINKLKEENKELKGMKERDIVAMVRDFHKETAIPYVLNNKEPLELPFMIGDIFIGIIAKEYIGIYFTAIRTMLKGSVSRYMWNFRGCDDFRKRMWELKNSGSKKLKKFVQLDYKNHAGPAVKKAKTHIVYKRAKKLMDLSDYNEFELSI